MTGECFHKWGGMSVSIEKGATFLGIPLVAVRNVLKAWRYGKTEDAHEIAIRKDVNLDPRTVMILLDELRDRDLIGPEKSEIGREFDGLSELPKHPNSPGRSNSIGDRREMPDLLSNRKMMRPLPADMTEPWRFHYRTMIETGPWPEDDWPYRWIQDKQSDIEMVTDHRPISAKIRQNAVTRRLSLKNLDGRERFGLFVCQRVSTNPSEPWESVRYPSLGLLIERAIRETKRQVKYGIQIADGAHKGKYADLIDLYSAVWWIYLMATADIEHILRREAEDGTQRSMEINLEASANKPVAAACAAEFSKYTQSLAKRFHGKLACPQIIISKLQDHVAALVGHEDSSAPGSDGLAVEV